MTQNITRQNILAAIKSAPHAICVNEIKERLGYSRTVASDPFNVIVSTLVANGVIKEHRRVRGNYFTNPDKRAQVDAIINPPVVPQSTGGGFTRNQVDILSFIKRAPRAVCLDEIKAALPGSADSANANVSVLFNAGYVKGHSKKYGYFYTNPEKASEINRIVATIPTVAPSTSGFSPDEAGVLAMLRLSDHGSSLTNIRAALASLKEKGFVREDKRDVLKPASDKRWFVRRGKRTEADGLISNRINETNNEIDASF